MKKFFSAFFILTIFIPHIISWEHVIGHDHEHEIYDNQFTDLHQLEEQCSVCLITRNSSDLAFNFSLAIVLLTFIRITKDFSFNSILDNSPFYVNSLRGPPIV